MKVAVALIAGTAQARVKEFCPLKQVPCKFPCTLTKKEIKTFNLANYECIRGPAGMWECSRECSHGAGKLHMDCECGPLHGCHWNDFGGRCIEDDCDQGPHQHHNNEHYDKYDCDINYSDRRLRLLRR